MARIAVGAASETARRIETLEARLIGRPADESLLAHVEDSDFAALRPIDDIRASAAYRIEAAREIVGRALIEAAGASDD